MVAATVDAPQPHRARTGLVRTTRLTRLRKEAPAATRGFFFVGADRSGPARWPAMTQRRPLVVSESVPTRCAPCRSHARIPQDHGKLNHASIADRGRSKF